WLELPAGAGVIARQVLLQGTQSKRIYAYAASLLVPERISEAISSGLVTDPQGIGSLLLNARMENFREVLWYGRERLCDLPASLSGQTGAQFISRTYRIIAGGQPV